MNIVRITTLIALASAGCSNGRPEPGSGVTRTDSAGVIIVDSPSPTVNKDVWRLSSAPILSIGVEEGPAPHELSDVAGALRLSDGRIVIANNGTRDIRSYDPQGRHLLTTGRDGAGPGEFRLITWIGRLEEDSVVVYDRRERRLTYLHPRGDYVRDVSLKNRDWVFLPNLLGVLSNGTFAAEYPIRLRGGAGSQLGRARDSIVSLTIDRDGAVRDTIGTFASRMIELQMREVGDNRMRLPGTLPFTPQTVMAARGGTIAIGNTDALSIRRYGPDGMLHQILRSPTELTPVTERHRDHIVDSLRPFCRRSAESRN